MVRTAEARSSNNKASAPQLKADFRLRTSHGLLRKTILMRDRFRG